MQEAVQCPLCKISVSIQQSMRKALKSSYPATKKSQVFCSQCTKTLREAFLASLQKTNH